ncbi:2-dehydropantoate 2-reductase [Mycotypha africana]|uniref:2-dehydropantoate 2-reductase n=1 Tax=Mycotypha africana TaxID=64632 RepID=UPI00230098E6|nr:2-dehydropantoate 2-reductase [Mycotypha africana]KAI8971643.1 2-dehydropantoate 2-reductase [Mycotypha africana]
MTIYLVGTGAIGCHIASILKLHKHNVTLLLRSQAHLNLFEARQNTISYRHFDKVDQVGGFSAKVVDDRFENTALPIHSLIVATKAQHTARAIEPLVKQLQPDSSILLLQNGAGVAEELTEKFWSNTTPPKIFVGVNRHAVERIAPFEIQHHSGFNIPKSLCIGHFPSNSYRKEQQVSKNSFLMQSLTSIPELQASYLPWQVVYHEILKKLVVNASGNGLAAILGCQNKYIVQPASLKIVKSLCKEAYEVLKDDLPDETYESLLKNVIDMFTLAGNNSCSMLQDIKAHRFTEVDYINGYLCRLGSQRGIDTRTNALITDLIHAKEAL